MAQKPMTFGKPLSLPWASTSTRPDSDRPARKLASGKFVTTVSLGSGTCKWPIGDPSEEDFHYCGHPPVAGRHYCDVHDRMSYQPARKRAS
jgi:GcrA cell cycle regulator